MHHDFGGILPLGGRRPAALNNLSSGASCGTSVLNCHLADKATSDISNGAVPSYTRVTSVNRQLTNFFPSSKTVSCSKVRSVTYSYLYSQVLPILFRWFSILVW